MTLPSTAWQTGQSGNPLDQEVERVARAMCELVENENQMTIDDYLSFGVGSRNSFVDKFWPNYANQAVVAIKELDDFRANK